MEKIMEKDLLIRDVETKNIMTKSSLPVGGYSVNPYVLEFPQFYPQSFKPTASVINNFQKMPKI